MNEIQKKRASVISTVLSGLNYKVLALEEASETLEVLVFFLPSLCLIQVPTVRSRSNFYKQKVTQLLKTQQVLNKKCNIRAQKFVELDSP